MHESEIYNKAKKAETGIDGEHIMAVTEDAQHHKHKKARAGGSLPKGHHFRWPLFDYVSLAFSALTLNMSTLVFLLSLVACRWPT